MKKNNWINLYENCFYNLISNKIKLNGADVHLTKKQALLLKILVANKNNVVKYETLLWQLNSDDIYNELNNKPLRNLVSNIRNQLPGLDIKNIYSTGYILNVKASYEKNLESFIPLILDQAQNGMVITDPDQVDNPIVYANKAFCDIFEYELDQFIGINCRFLQAGDRHQKGIKLIREAVKNKTSITATLRNYTKSGKTIYNEVTISPIFDQSTGKIIYFLGVQKQIDEKYYNQYYE